MTHSDKKQTEAPARERRPSWTANSELPSVPIPVPSDRTPVADIMTKKPLTVQSNMSTETATALLLENDISGMPVVDEDGRPVGVISKSDLVRDHYEASIGGETVERVVVKSTTGGEYHLDHGFHIDRIVGTEVGDVMMPLAFTVKGETSLARAAALMAKENIHRVPVVDDDNKVVGILTTLDVLRWLASEAGY